MTSEAPPLDDAIVIRASNLSKSFGGVRAVQDCSFVAKAGKITGRIGPTGGGKSTLMALLAVATRADAGQVHFDGQDVTALHDWQRARLGLVRTFQVSRPLPHMTVLENISKI